MVPLLFGVCILIGCCLWLSSRKYRHYPGLGIPVLGDLYGAFTSFTISYPNLVNEIYKDFDKYGDTYCKRFGPVVIIFTADTDLIQELSVHPFMSDKEPLIYDSFRPLFDGPFSASYADKKWKKDRKIILEVMKRNFMEKYHDVFVQRALELTEALENISGELDIQPLVMLMCLDIVCENMAAYPSTYLQDKELPLYEDFKRANDEAMPRILCLGLRKMDSKYRRTFKHLHRSLLQICRHLVENIGKRDRDPQFQSDYIPLLEYMVQDILEIGGSIEDMLPCVTEIFIEAFYATGIVLSGTLLFLAVYPEVQEKAWIEQKEIFLNSLRSPTLSDVKRMEYLERVVKDAARIVTSPNLPRRAKGDIKIGSHFIPKNATVVYSYDRVRKDPRYWKTPNRFNPDHFLPEQLSSRPKAANMSFGLGIRNCPGMQYGLNLSKVVISSVIRKFKISSPLKPSDVKFEPSVFMRLKGPHTIIAEPRNL